MEKESFRILKEINSLYLEISQLTTTIESENGRVQKIRMMQDERKELIEKFNKQILENRAELATTENSIAQKQQKLDQDLNNIKNVFTELEIKSLESQIGLLKEQLDELENSGLTLMETIELAETEIKDAQTFLTGSEETITELTLEIQEVTDPHHKKISINQSRIELLFTSFDSHTKEKYLKLLAKNMKYGPLAQIEKNHCSICKLEIPQIEIDQIEKQLMLKSCSSCQRLFIPITSLY